MRILTLFDPFDLFSSPKILNHHIQTEVLPGNQLSVKFSVQTPGGGSLILNEAEHGKHTIYDMIERVSSHTMWQNWLREEINERGACDPITQNVANIAKLRHMQGWLPTELLG